MEGWYEAGGVVDDEGVDQVCRDLATLTYPTLPSPWIDTPHPSLSFTFRRTRLFYNLRLPYLGQHGDIAGWGVLLRFLDHTLSVFNGRHTASNNFCASVSLDAGRNELIAVVVIQPSPTVGEVIRAVRFKHSRSLQGSA
ncbi:predicted protein [Histoplasma capsulatum G186AR]|uniref:Uncharacterized protein n=1 Tax=Ajellomyces capsulatus (strain G186AR / H82 / ATCC MYA-2454 / RMSCC 2432) TaxID=447093 RepID=C0NYD6_AJECG|nr:uncharacterized protein HCBG_07930 [Histoplasma capsulatum G186AR]EEH03804.1 predicted protein [Histoplasma capsulatum G186AR]